MSIVLGTKHIAVNEIDKGPCDYEVNNTQMCKSSIITHGKYYGEK